tara:strand:- start:18 stop:440 length:423 start_codon:yes stop_codon:yes gene_type:complete
VTRSQLKNKLKEILRNKLSEETLDIKELWSTPGIETRPIYKGGSDLRWLLSLLNRTPKSGGNTETAVAVQKEEDLEEMNSTASVGGEYMTPMAFDPKQKKKKIKEELEPKDVQHVRKIVKEIINNMFRDIWLKRNSWNKI